MPENPLKLFPCTVAYHAKFRTVLYQMMSVDRVAYKIRHPGSTQFGEMFKIDISLFLFHSL